MGFCGLYGISEIRDQVVKLKRLETDSTDTSIKGIEIINHMRQSLITSEKFKSAESLL